MGTPDLHPDPGRRTVYIILLIAVVLDTVVKSLRLTIDFIAGHLDRDILKSTSLTCVSFARYALKNDLNAMKNISKMF